MVFLLCKLINKLKFSKGEAGPEFPFKSSYGDKIGHYGIGINQKNKKKKILWTLNDLHCHVREPQLQ